MIRTECGRSGVGLPGLHVRLGLSLTLEDDVMAAAALRGGSLAERGQRHARGKQNPVPARADHNNLRQMQLKSEIQTRCFAQLS